MIRDIDIRTTLRSSELTKYSSDRSSLIIEELGLENGEARIDVAVVNGSFLGYEIKSDADTLARLPGQLHIYNKIFDYLHIVVGEKHLKESEDMLPAWWGITVAKKGPHGNEVVLNKYREAEQNEHQDIVSISRLLWKDEVLQLLREKNVDRGLKSKPRSILYQRLPEFFQASELKEKVRGIIKARKCWRVVEPEK